MHAAWSGDHAPLRRAHARGRVPARRRRAARPGRGRPRRRARPTTPLLCRLVVGRRARRGSARASTRHLRGRAPRTRTARPVMRQHVGGGLLRPRPRPAADAGRRRRRGRGRAVRPRRRLVPRPPRRHAPGSATGRSTPTSGRTACTRWSTTCTRLGMEFGLWVEPEMVNPDSDLARAPPRLGAARPRGALPPAVAPPAGARPRAPGRLRVPARTRSTRCSTEYDIAYLKWDHNRDLTDAAPRRAGRPCTRRPWPFYRLLDELRAAHPGLEIESCASGGARVDLGILARTDRVWASDTNDALERQRIQRWTVAAACRRS